MSYILKDYSSQKKVLEQPRVQEPQQASWEFVPEVDSNTFFPLFSPAG